MFFLFQRWGWLSEKEPGRSRPLELTLICYCLTVLILMPATGSEAQNTTGVVYLQDPFGQDLSSKVPEGLQDIVAVAAADDANLALRKDGTVFEWSTASDLKVVLTGASSIDARGHRRLAVMTDGATLAWNSGGTFLRLFEGIRVVRGTVPGTFPYTFAGKTD